MSFKRVPQKFNASINAVTLGGGENTVTLGGENVFPLYTFDAPIENPPRIGFEISDEGVNKNLPGIAEFFAGADTVLEQVKKAVTMPGVDFIALRLDSASPDGANRPVEECAAFCKEILDAVDFPFVIIGCKNIEKDGELFAKCAEALQGKNVLFMSAREENYKGVAASAGLAYGHKVGAESAVDINLAKQLNVLISQIGVSGDNVVMNLGSSAAGYGFEYTASTMDRVRSAALAQNDAMLQMPVITPVGSEAWAVKEAIVSEEDFPEWGPVEERGIDMEIVTAAACIAAGSNAVVLQHPASVATMSAYVAALM